MKIDQELIETLLGAVRNTRDDEVSCQTCEDSIARFAESSLAGQEIPQALRAIETHLSACPECAEELNFLYRALQDDDPGDFS